MLMPATAIFKTCPLWFLYLVLLLRGVEPALFTLQTSYASTAVDDASVGDITWADAIEAAGAPNDEFATATAVNPLDVSHYLKATNFSFTIPVGATINGVQVRVAALGYTEIAGAWLWDKVRLVNSSGTIGSANKATGALPTTLATASFGGSADTWSGEANNDWNDADSGFVIAVIANASTSGTAIAYMDGMEILITYTAAAGTVAPRRTIIGKAQKVEFKKLARVESR